MTTKWYERGKCGEYVLRQVEAVLDGMKPLDEFRWDMSALGLTDDEIEEMLEDALEHAETDVDQRLLIEVRVEAEQVLKALSGALKADASLVGEEERNLIQKAAQVCLRTSTL